MKKFPSQFNWSQQWTSKYPKSAFHADASRNKMKCFSSLSESEEEEGRFNYKQPANILIETSFVAETLSARNNIWLWQGMKMPKNSDSCAYHTYAHMHVSIFKSSSHIITMPTWRKGNDKRDNQGCTDFTWSTKYFRLHVLCTWFKRVSRFHYWFFHRSRLSRLHGKQIMREWW